MEILPVFAKIFLGSYFGKGIICGQIFDDELDLAYAVIDGVKARGEKGKYSTKRIKFDSNRSG
ncbi:hypothetical protein LC605_15820 [Nostoc sp. CHAB 5836]|uniref:hypothetical protein n=1 Tax=Nostoc sp. CHAB 5836 TaxID=2780404 RepID=UPI001E6599D9|nr:hypothetical protein [Nostoc sp. CHAB 5836]MCC5616512.1 hypothetical protein [Nostoc sp. CHAB 5836]